MDVNGSWYSLCHGSRNTAFLLGGFEQIEYAAKALEHHLGLTCDPIGGYVQVPCIERNAKAGKSPRFSIYIQTETLVSFDQVKQPARTGRDLRYEYKETSLGLPS